MAAPATAVLINGRRCEEIAVADRGLQFGDGLFETLAVLDGRPCLLDAHLQRLGRGCERLGLPRPPEALLRREIQELTAGAPRAVLKLIFTAGHGPRGYARARRCDPTRILSLTPAPPQTPAHWEQGVAIGYCRLRLGAQPALAGIKHLNRLEQVLARRELGEAPEGLLLDGQGAVVEGVASNVFAVLGERLLTPLLDRCGVAGVMRARILDLAAQWGWQVAETAVFPEQLHDADEVFLSNSLIGVWPVSSLDGRQYKQRARARTLLAALAAERAFLIPQGVSFAP